MEQIHLFSRWCCRGRAFLIMITAALIVTVNTTNMSAMADTSSKDDKDLQECAQQLAGLSTCLTFVQGQAKAPIPDCCSGLKQVLKEDRKCLCVIVVRRSDPQLGLNINATLALSLPTVCAAPANVSLCPALLHLAPDSAEAQVFLQFAKNSSRTASAPTANSRSAENITNDGAHEQKSGDDGSTQKTALQFWEGIIFGLLLVTNIL